MLWLSCPMLAGVRQDFRGFEASWNICHTTRPGGLDNHHRNQKKMSCRIQQYTDLCRKFHALWRSVAPWFGGIPMRCDFLLFLNETTTGTAESTQTVSAAITVDAEVCTYISTFDALQNPGKATTREHPPEAALLHKFSLFPKLTWSEHTYAAIASTRFVKSCIFQARLSLSVKNARTAPAEHAWFTSVSP